MLVMTGNPRIDETFGGVLSFIWIQHPLLYVLNMYDTVGLGGR